jgi:hypothetical protein
MLLNIHARRYMVKELGGCSLYSQVFKAWNRAANLGPVAIGRSAGLNHMLLILSFDLKIHL